MNATAHAENRLASDRRPPEPQPVQAPRAARRWRDALPRQAAWSGSLGRPGLPVLPGLLGGLLAVLVFISGALTGFAGHDAASRSVMSATNPSDPGRLLGPLALLVDIDAARADATGLSALRPVPLAGGDTTQPRSGSLRYRHRFLSWHLLTPLRASAEGIIVAGELVVIEDSDDEVATTIVYRFASDGSIVASAPGGALLGSIDPASQDFLARLRDTPRQGITVRALQS